jgi:hypothetical protein
MTRRGWIGPEAGLSMARQCALAGVYRSTVYVKRTPSLVQEAEYCHYSISSISSIP